MKDLLILILLIIIVVLLAHMGGCTLDQVRMGAANIIWPSSSGQIIETIPPTSVQSVTPSPQNTLQPQATATAFQQIDCTMPYTMGWDVNGRVVQPGTISVNGHYVFLVKNQSGANIGVGIYATALPRNRGILHVWSFTSRQCAELNLPYIRGQ